MSRAISISSRARRPAGALLEGKLEWKRRGAREVEMVALAEVASRAAVLVRDGDGTGASGA